LTVLSAHAVGLHHGGIGPSAVTNIRRKIRDGQNGLLPVMERLLRAI
jgi:hypothetical protein